MPRKRPEGRLNTETAQEVRALDQALQNPMLSKEAYETLSRLREKLMKVANEEAASGGGKAKG
jgi:hypothetical protein